MKSKNIVTAYIEWLTERPSYAITLTFNWLGGIVPASAEEKIRIVLAGLRGKFAWARLTNPIRCISKKLLDYFRFHRVRHKLKESLINARCDAVFAA
jgi:hypothetical protein